MKGTLRLFVLLTLATALSGCIMSTSPDPSEKITMHPLNIETFLVIASKAPYPSNTTLSYEWYVDDEWTGNSSCSFIYIPRIRDIGDHVIQCRVEVRKYVDGGYEVIWSDFRKWDVEVVEYQVGV